MRRNWEQIFAFVPDVHAEVVQRATDGDTAWTEWDMTGTRPDGSAHHMAGVIVFGVGDDMVQRARFYLEPVDEASLGRRRRRARPGGPTVILVAGGTGRLGRLVVHRLCAFGLAGAGAHP